MSFLLLPTRLNDCNPFSVCSFIQNASFLADASRQKLSCCCVVKLKINGAFSLKEFSDAPDTTHLRYASDGFRDIGKTEPSNYFSKILTTSLTVRRQKMNQEMLADGHDKSMPRDSRRKRSQSERVNYCPLPSPAQY